MPKTPDETDQQWMDRLRTARGLPPQNADTLMTRTRAAVGFLNASHNGSEASKLNAFLALFHPEVEAGTPLHLSLMQDARARDRVSR